MLQTLKNKILDERPPSMDGFQHSAIRIFRYCTGGVDLINQFRNLAIILFGIYVVLKIDNPWWLFCSFLISLPILTVLGWYRVHKMDKVLEWLNIKFTTHYGFAQYNLQVESLKTLKSINKKLK